MSNLAFGLIELQDFCVVGILLPTVPCTDGKGIKTSTIKYLLFKLFLDCQSARCNRLFRN